MTRDEPRLEMNPNGAATGSVDGGWWPRSLDPTATFPELIAALHPWVGPVSRIVRYDGFHTMDPHTVTAIGTNTRRVSVLVVPPDTPAAR